MSLNPALEPEDEGRYFPDDPEDSGLLSTRLVETWAYFWFDNQDGSPAYGAGYLQTTEDAKAEEMLPALRSQLNRPMCHLMVFRVGIIGAGYQLLPGSPVPEELNMTKPPDAVMEFGPMVDITGGE